MTHLAWNCRGSGGNLSSSTMLHLTRLIQSTKPEAMFLSETCNSTVSVSSLKNHFNLNDAFIVPSQCQSGGLCITWNDEIKLTIFDHSQNYVLTICTNNNNNLRYGLVCMYGDPLHRSMSIIWTSVKNFISLNSTLPMLCMGDLNEIMHPSEKLGPAVVNFNHMNALCSLVK
jgi:hypothetical protein